MPTSPNRLLATIVGAVYLAVGLLGLLVASHGLLFGVLEVNLAQDLLHLVVGVALLVAGLTGRGARTANTTAGTFFLVLGIFGLFVAGTAANVLALGPVDHVLHFGSAVFLLCVGLGTETTDRPALAREGSR
ncbi:MAG TPA: DUF4383 domain-containing protein [Lacisediminihabitans sp.]|uniref:DUF4383 domain-containing protein n=1 Tax=Lacisediminihabitans sp. TaxID=2787631 RepID=UPI002EDA5183